MFAKNAADQYSPSPAAPPFSLDSSSAQKQKIRSLFLYRIDNRKKKIDTTNTVSSILRWKKIVVNLLFPFHYNFQTRNEQRQKYQRFAVVHIRWSVAVTLRTPVKFN